MPLRLPSRWCYWFAVISMPGYFKLGAVWPRPLEFIARLALVATLVLLLVHTFQRALVVPLLPIFGGAILALDDSFTVLNIEVVHEGQNEVMRLRANLARPVEVAGHIVYPFGWGPIPAGGYQVTITL